MRSGMRSQWRLMSAGEMCSERRKPNMSCAVAFYTDWRRRISAVGRPYSTLLTTTIRSAVLYSNLLTDRQTDKFSCRESGFAFFGYTGVVCNAFVLTVLAYFAVWWCEIQINKQTDKSWVKEVITLAVMKRSFLALEFSYATMCVALWHPENPLLYNANVNQTRCRNKIFANGSDSCTSFMVKSLFKQNIIVHSSDS